jgi:hypothetical protein
MTRFWKFLPFAALTLFPVGTVSAAALLQPGTPCPVGTAPAPCSATITSGTFSVSAQALNTNIANDPGITNLNAFVVPGTVVLCESPSTNGCLSSPPTAWSDVIQFFDLPNGGGSAAQVYADNENGVVGLPPGFTPSLNAVSLTEVQTGFGDDRDFTSYTPSAGTTYTIHSDCGGPGCEIPDPETPEPSTLMLFGSGLAAVGLFHRRRRA